jgi:hypothetical protein
MLVLMVWLLWQMAPEVVSARLKPTASLAQATVMHRGATTLATASSPF